MNKTTWRIVRTVRRFTIKLPLVLAVCQIMSTWPASAVAWRWPYLCFFDIGSADIDPKCERVLDVAVASWHREQEGREYRSDSVRSPDDFAPAYTARFEIVGFAPDTRSSEQGQTLSLRRAAAVAQALRKRGIPEELLTIIGQGDDIPLVAGHPFDPQNRQVDIRLR